MSVIGIEGNAGTMRRVVVMPVEGILRKEIGGQLNPDGFYLYRTLLAMYRVILVSMGEPEHRVLDWLSREGIFGYDDIIFPMGMCLNGLESTWTNIIRVLRQRGYNLTMAVLNGPQDALDVHEAGVPTLLYTQPVYGLPDWLPGSSKGHQAWSRLVETVEGERALRLADKRMEAGLE